MKKLLSIIASLLLFSSALAQVCPVSFSYVRTVSGTKRLYTLRQFEPCADYATQIAIMVALAINKQQYPAAIFLSGNTLQNNRAWGQSFWTTQHLYTVE